MKKFNLFFAIVFIAGALLSCNKDNTLITGLNEAKATDQPIPLCDTWIDETAWACGPDLTGITRWGTYVDYNYSMSLVAPEQNYFVTTFTAGQNEIAGRIYFYRPADGKVKVRLVILRTDVRFADNCVENLKAENFDTPPTDMIKLGKFSFKNTIDPSVTNIVFYLPENNYYAVHLDLQLYTGPCPVL